MTNGTLYIISTPIGNMSDMTFRAVEQLKNVSIILSEDTRETGKILTKYEITKPQISYRDQNHQKVIGEIMDILKSGQDMALVSDSGTPLISDPGFKLVSKLVENGIEVKAVPGPSAVVSALVVSGLPTDKFSFLGFLPKSKGQSGKILKNYGQLDSTLVIYESPNRIIKLLDEIYENLGNRKIAVVSELTKIYEKVIRGTVEEVKAKFQEKNIKGEFVVLVAKEGF